MNKSNVEARLVSAREGKRGITLIALIITIVIMLILVAVSVRILINSNIIGIAEETANKTKTAYEEESKLDIDLSKYINRDSKPTITAGERATSNSTYTDSKGKTAVIPEGFTVSGLKNDTVDETTIDDGLVIYLIPEGTTVNWTDATEVANAQKTYDQFVWIPIKNTTDATAQDINDMYICQGKTTNNGVCEIKVVNGIAECQTAEHKTLAEDGTTYKNTLMAGRLYATSTGENFEKAYTEVYTSGSGLREPDTLSSRDNDSTYLGYLSSILGTTGYDSIANFKQSLQTEYNEVVKSVYENQGFYVGRYETSNMTSTDGTAVKVIAGTTSGITNKNWYYMYAQQKDYATNKGLSVGSTMIQGAAYDQVMKFVDPNNTWIKTTGRVSHDLGSGNYYQTGGLNYSGTITYNDVEKNIYDLEGNVGPWTTEANDTNFRGYRGGYYDGSGSASYRYSFFSPNYSFDNFGSLCQLYVK